MKTKDRLAKDLSAAGAPLSMVRKAKAGYYDDYETTLAAPQNQLITDCLNVGLGDIAQKAIEGKYDGSADESSHWLKKNKHVLD